VGTQDPDGLTASQAMQLVRAVAIQNEVVAADFMEYNPFMDDAHQTTGVLMDRLIRTLLAGIAARKQGITDPLFVDPRRVDHGVPSP
jgi:agmatinase